MPLVYVHGVGNRTSPTYPKGVAARTALFRSFLLTVLSSNPAEATVVNPFWGDYGSRFAWNGASFPGKNTATLSGEDSELAALIAEATAGTDATNETILLTAARQSLAQAVDILWTLALAEADPTTAQSLADLAVHAAAYAQQNPTPAWLSEVQNDQALLQQLGRAVEQSAEQAPLSAGPSLTLGPAEFFEARWDKLQAQAKHLAELPAWWLSRQAMDMGRESVTKMVTDYIGDAMVYLSSREKNGILGPIVQTVLDGLLQADAARTPSDPYLTVISHSMGGNIVYDILTSWAATLAPKLKLDLWVTVGSQVALLEELKLYRSSDPAIPADPTKDRVVRPANVARWINVFDENDGLGFATAGVFADTTDFSYSTGKSLIAAHGAYFKLPSFHQRLTERVKAAMQETK